MKTNIKKYFSISEVAKITGLPHHKLRYFEKTNSKLEIRQIRGRRYYTKENIEYIKQKFTLPVSYHDSNILSQIDFLISKFTQLEEKISKEKLL